MRFVCSFILFLICSTVSFAQAIWQYDSKESNKDNLGVYTTLAVNTTAGLHSIAYGSSPTVKGAQSITTAIGVFYQKGIGSRLSLRFGFNIGKANHAYKYAQNFDSISTDMVPLLSSKFKNYTRVNNRIPFVMPQIDLGYVFGPFNKLYLIEVRAGVGLQAYIDKSSDTIIFSNPSVIREPKSGNIFQYRTQHYANYGNGDFYGSVVANVYIGLRWHKTTSHMLNHFAVGIQSTVPFGMSNSGYSDIVYSGTQNNQAFTIEKVNLALLCFGVKATYNFL